MHDDSICAIQQRGLQVILLYNALRMERFYTGKPVFLNIYTGVPCTHTYTFVENFEKMVESVNCRECLKNISYTCGVQFIRPRCYSIESSLPSTHSSDEEEVVTS